MNIRALIEILGWSYFVAWSFSFYGQLILNFRLKSVQGMNLSYLYLNITGYIFYSIYCSYGYFNPNSDQTDRINLHDLIFAVHALIICTCKFVQTIIYPRGKNTLNPIVKNILIVIILFSITYGLFTKILGVYHPPPKLSIFNIFGYLKLLNTFIKYLPQMIWNFQRESTVGFSICGVMMDLSGGILLLIQMYLEKIYMGFHMNTVKLLLAIISIAYNIVFIVQRFLLYPEAWSNFQKIREVRDEVDEKEDCYNKLAFHCS